MAVAVSDFRVDHPQFANSTTYPDSTISRALTRAGLRMNADVWGDLYDEGQSLLAAHLLALGAIAASSQGSNTGGMTGVNISGQGSIQFAQNPTSRASQKSSYSATRYGIEYESLLTLVTAGSVRIF